MEPLPISESSFARVMSIDVLRGIVIFAMIFVNDIAGGRGVPSWMEHYPGDKSGMTFVDVVFPAFLFIVGMSIPLSIESRRRRGHSWLRIFGHILLRTAGLLFVGVLMVEHPNDTAIGWRGGTLVAADVHRRDCDVCILADAIATIAMGSDHRALHRISWPDTACNQIPRT